MSSRSHTNLRRHSSHLNRDDEFHATHAKSDTDLFARGRESASDGVDDHNVSVDQMSSDIDNILQEISSGHIISSSTNDVSDSNMKMLFADKDHGKICITIKTLLCDFYMDSMEFKAVD